MTMQAEPRIYHLKIDNSGRMVLPAEIRARHQIKSDQTLVMTDDGRSMQLRTRSEVLAEAQEYFRSLVPPGISLVDELLEERRIEAELENRRS